MQATIPTCKLPNAMHCFGTVLLTTNRDERRRKKTGPKTRLQLGLASDDETSKQNACTGNIQHNHSPLPNGTARHCMACYGLLLMSYERVVYSGGFIVLLPPLICCMVNFIYSTFEAQKITNTALPLLPFDVHTHAPNQIYVSMSYGTEPNFVWLLMQHGLMCPAFVKQHIAKLSNICTERR